MGVLVIVGTAKGAALLRSDTSRQSWDVDALRMKGWAVTAATRDARGRYYVAVAADVFGPAILASDDGKSWEQLESSPRYMPTDVGNDEHNRIAKATDFLNQIKPGSRYVDQIWKLHVDGDVVYAGVSEAGLFRSDDRGKSWQVVPGINEHPDRPGWMPGFGGLCAHSVLTDARDSDRIWVGISSAGVFRSDDGGATFVSKNEGVNAAEGWCVHSLAHDPNDAGVIYRQDHRGVYRTRDGGDSWQLIESGLPISELSDGLRCSFGFASAMDPASDSVYLVPIEGDNFRFPHGGELRVYRSRDGGDQWEPLSNGLPDGTYGNILRGAMAVDRLDPCGVYFGTTAGAVYASPDGGDSWGQIPCTLPKVMCVEAFEV
jgi:photosystem II stability/assembly factor-like uncharacterized protein